MNADNTAFPDFWRVHEIACNAVLNNWPLKFVLRDLEIAFPGHDLLMLREVAAKKFQEMAQLEVAEFFMHDAQGRPIFLNAQEAFDVIAKDSSWKIDGTYVAPVPMGDRKYFRDLIEEFATLRQAGARSNKTLDTDPPVGSA